MRQRRDAYAAAVADAADETGKTYKREGKQDDNPKEGRHIILFMYRISLVRSCHSYISHRTNMTYI